MRDYYKAYEFAKGIQGDVVEIGLGWGYIADALAGRNLTSYERDPDRVREYQKKSPSHTIIEKDFLEDTAKTKFDIAIVDVFNTKDDYENGKDIVNKLNSRMKREGKIMIEYQTDSPTERDFRQFMKDRFGPPETEFINTGTRSTSRNVCYYKI